MKTTLKRIAKAPAWPFLRYFDRRFQDVHGHLDAQVGAFDAGVDRGAASARALQDRVATDLETVSELTLTLERFADRFGDRMDDVLATLQRLLEPTEMPGICPAELVELPFAHAAARRLPAGARVVVLAHPMSALPLSLASLGFSVTAFDVAPQPRPHPELRIVSSPIEEWEGPATPIDGGFVLSDAPCRNDTSSGSTETGAHRALAFLRKWMQPGGTLVLATARPHPAAGSTGGVSDAGEPAALLVEWDILDRQLYRQLGAQAWERASDAESPAARGSGARELELLLLTPRA